LRREGFGAVGGGKWLGSGCLVAVVSVKRMLSPSGTQSMAGGATERARGSRGRSSKREGRQRELRERKGRVN